MKQHIENTRRQLGELGAMSAQNEAMERQIMERAQKLLADVESKIEPARAASTSKPDDYMALIEERGRLQQVIAQARAVLAG